MIEFLTLVGIAYFMSIGTGMLIGQGKGLKWVNRQWLKAIGWTIQQIANLLSWFAAEFAGKKKKKKRKK